MKKPKVSVVILNFNGLSYTLDCIKSVKKTTFKDFEIIVVDNGSVGNDVQVLSKVKGIKLIKNDRNYGFAEGNNIGTRHALGKYVALLNNDTLVDKSWLSELVKAIEKDELIAICNPKFFDKYDRGDYYFDGFGTLGLFMAPVLLRKIDKDTEKYVRTIFARGSAFFRREIIGEPFDPDYFAYAEDAQLGWRANLQGFKVIEVPTAIVFHEGAVTAKSMKVPKDFFFILAERNKMLNILTLYSGWTLARLLPYWFAHSLFSALYQHSKIPARFKVFMWLMANFRLVMKKRRALQSRRKVNDSQIIKLMSCKLQDEGYVKNSFLRAILKTINFCFMAYCVLVCLRTVEFHKLKEQEGIISP